MKRGRSRAEEGQIKLAQGSFRGLELGVARWSKRVEDPCPELKVGFHQVNEGKPLKPFSGKLIFLLNTINFWLRLFHNQVFMLPNNEETLGMHLPL